MVTTATPAPPPAHLRGAGTTAGGSGTTEATGTTVAQDDVCTADRVGGSVTFGQLAPVAGLDPTVAFGSGSQGSFELTALFDTLMRYDTTTGEYVPHLAQSLEPNADLTVWTLKLRPRPEVRQRRRPSPPTR